jgi:hypothetical protein
LDIIITMGIIFPDCIMDIIDIIGIIPDAFVGIIAVIDLFISIPMFIGTMTIMEVFIPDAFMTFMGIIFIDIWDCIIIPDAFMGIITIMGTIIIHVMLAGQAFIMGLIAAFAAFIGIIAMQFIPAGHELIIDCIMGCIIFPEFIISPAMGSIAAIATIPINARSMADVILLDVVI